MKLHSLKDLGEVYNLKPRTHKLEKRKCFKCGGEMHCIEGTNIFVCTGAKKDESGNVKPCTNRLIVGQKK